MKGRPARARTARSLAWTLAAAALIASSLPAFGQNTKASGGGSYKSFFNWIYNAGYQGESAGVFTGLLRLNGSLYPNDWLSLEGAYLLYPQIMPEIAAAQPGASPTGGGEEYRVWDPRARLVPSSTEDIQNVALYHEIDRALATFRLPFADLSLGRQAVAWGSAHIVNPTDVIVPLRFTALETENRKGVDAVRFRMPFGSMNELDTGAIFGENFEPAQSAFFARTKLYVAMTDTSLLSMVFRENLLLGLDLSRAIGEAGAWLETAYVLPGIVGASHDAGGDDYFSLSVGADRNIVADLYGYVEYHYNSAGGREPEDYPEIMQTPAYTEGNVYLLGRHYVGVGGTYNAAPLLPVNVLLLANLSDLSLELSVSALYNFKENVYVGGGLFVGLGAPPDTAGGVPKRYRSEFGAYPQVLYTQVEIYF